MNGTKSVWLLFSQHKHRTTILNLAWNVLNYFKGLYFRRFMMLSSRHALYFWCSLSVLAIQFNNVLSKTRAGVFIIEISGCLKTAVNVKCPHAPFQIQYILMLRVKPLIGMTMVSMATTHNVPMVSHVNVSLLKPVRHQNFKAATKLSLPSHGFLTPEMYLYGTIPSMRWYIPSISVIQFQLGLAAIHGLKTAPFHFYRSFAFHQLHVFDLGVELNLLYMPYKLSSLLATIREKCEWKN